jgi:5-methylcytosine-specific restriction enzyme A
MPRAAPRPCTEPRCKEFAVNRGKCKDHQPINWSRKAYRMPGWAWSRLKPSILVRDGYLCQVCLKRGIYTEASEVDHVIPLAKGGSNDHSNLVAICGTCHEHKTITERVMPKRRIRTPAIPVTLVCGPPGAGKTTYCLNNRNAGDQIIDFDMIVEELSGQSRRQVDSSAWARKALMARNWRLDALADASQGRAWVVMSLPRLCDREEWAARLKADVIMIDPGYYECQRRIEQDATRGHIERAKSMIGLAKWYDLYSHRAADMEGGG